MKDNDSRIIRMFLSSCNLSTNTVRNYLRAIDRFRAFVAYKPLSKVSCVPILAVGARDRAESNQAVDLEVRTPPSDSYQNRHHGLRRRRIARGRKSSRSTMSAAAPKRLF